MVLQRLRFWSSMGKVLATIANGCSERAHAGAATKVTYGAEGTGLVAAYPGRAGCCHILTLVGVVPTAVEG